MYDKMPNTYDIMTIYLVKLNQLIFWKEINIA